MNRLILIGNGFDLAHGLPTRYEDFVKWYWDKRVERLSKETRNISYDPICTISAPDGFVWAAIVANRDDYNYKHCPSSEIIRRIEKNDYGFSMKCVPFFNNIRTSIESKGWVDIENEYYDLLKEYALPVIHQPYKETVAQLNAQLRYMQELLIEYLEEVEQREVSVNKAIRDAMYAPFKATDISVKDEKCFQQHIERWRKYPTEVIEQRVESYGFDVDKMMQEVREFEARHADKQPNFSFEYPEAYKLPDSVIFLNFNYTSTAHRYLANYHYCFDNHIHGDIREEDGAGIIFGYGDELDEDFTRLQNLNDNECLRNVKSIRYLEASNYRNALTFIESGPFQVYIMGHSCGNSDRTLLNTIFEHRNCLSIKPYYHVKEDGTDNFIEIVQNISRNFKNMKLMRDRVVNKTLCEPLPQNRKR